MKAENPGAQGWYSIVGEPTSAALRPLRAIECIQKLSITKSRRITVRHARALRTIGPIKWLWLWCDVTRTAMQHIVQVPGLEVLDVLNITGPGLLSGFEAATTLHTVRANLFLKALDIVAITKCATLQELGVQGAELTSLAIAAMLSLQRLHSLDVEGSNFDDGMAKQLSTSTVLTHLDVGATKITRAGLAYLVSMKQLRSLDLWATGLDVDELELLNELPKLEFVSVGNFDRLDVAKLMTLLLSLPALKHVWLDGVEVTDDQEAALERKLESLRITPNE